MALAPFFDKAALAAAAVLQDFDRERFVATLDAETVVIAFDDAAVGSTEGRTTLTLAVNLAARLYPELVLAALGCAANGYRRDLEALARAVNPDIGVVMMVQAASGKGTVALVVGSAPAASFGCDPNTTAIYVGSAGWDARVSTAGPVGSGASALPFGAAAAACLGAANVFRHVFRAQLPASGLDDALTLSTLSLTTRLAADASSTSITDQGAFPLPGSLDIGHVVQAGAGAVGQGFLWTVVRVPALEGTIDVVDADVIDDSNLQRYVLTAAGDVGASKVALAGSLLPTAPSAQTTDRPCGHPHQEMVLPEPPAGLIVREVPASARASLSLIPHPVRWGAFLAARPQPWHLKRVVVALDSARDRIAVQAALPRWIANAWTQPGDLGLSRHQDLGAVACLACLYVPTGAVMNEDARVASEVGLPDLMLVRRLLATGAPLDDAILSQMATNLGVAVDRLVPYRGRPLRAFYSEAVCGGVVMRLQSEQRRAAHEGVGSSGPDAAPAQALAGRPKDRATMVPMAFQSVMAGVLLAAALVADAADLPTPPAGQKLVLDLLRPVTRRLLSPVAPHTSGKCLCQDADFRAAFAAQWDA